MAQFTFLSECGRHFPLSGCMRLGPGGGVWEPQVSPWTGQGNASLRRSQPRHQRPWETLAPALGPPSVDLNAIPISHTCHLAIWLQDGRVLCFLSHSKDSPVLKITSLVDNKFFGQLAFGKRQVGYAGICF